MPDNFNHGAAHTFELQYLFGPAPTTADSDFTKAQSALAEKMVEKMVEYWTNFAKTGDPTPSSDAGTSWPEYSGDDTGRYLQFVPASSHVITDFGDRHHCAFWAGLF